MSQPTPASLAATDAGGRDVAVDAALRDLEAAAAADDPQRQIDAAQHVHDVLRGRLSGVSDQ